MRGTDVPVVLLTAQGTVESATEVIRAGAYDYLTKPADPRKLQRLLEKALRARRDVRTGYLAGPLFISYAREDAHAVRPLYTKLLLRGFQPWMDSENLPAGAQWRYEIDKVIRTSSVFIACLSRNSVAKRGMIRLSSILVSVALPHPATQSNLDAVDEPIPPVRFEVVHPLELSEWSRNLTIVQPHWVPGAD